MFDVVHCRNLYRLAAANVKRLRFREEIGELVFPRRLEIDCIRQDQARGCVNSIWRNQIADPVACLVGHPFVNVLTCVLRIFFEIERFERRTVEFFHKLTKGISKIVAALSEEPVCDRKGDRLAWPAHFF